MEYYKNLQVLYFLMIHFIIVSTFFHIQRVKVHGGKQKFYPTPTKTYVPNLEKRRPDLQVIDSKSDFVIIERM